MISLIACMDSNLAIGYKNELLTHLPNDLSHFKKLTENKVCVMGRKTMDSIMERNGRPLPNRHNVIISRNTNYKKPKNTYLFTSIKGFVEAHGQDDLFKSKKEVMVIGGGEIYKEFLPYADRLYITHIHNKFNRTDAFFPKFSLDEWNIKKVKHNTRDDKHPYDYTYLTFDRRRSK